MSALPDHVSAVSPLRPRTSLDLSIAQTSHDRLREVNGQWGYEEDGVWIPVEPAEVYVLPVPPPPPAKEHYWADKARRRKVRPAPPEPPAPPGPRRRRAVLVARADPMVWARVLELGWDPERISIGTDGSVTLHNHAWQAIAARRKELE